MRKCYLDRCVHLARSGNCRNCPQERTKHHRRCKVNGGSAHDPHNISFAPRLKHDAFHTLFGHMEAEQIAYILNTHWLDPRFQLVVERSANARPD